jgi:putative ABC transport system permease protein
MTTLPVRERPAPAAYAGNGGTPARRAVIRWAWRLFRREWRQQLLIMALITVAVAGTVLGAAVASNTPASPGAATFGTANHLVTMPGREPHLAADIAAIRQRFGPVDVIENQNLVTGSTSQVQLRAQSPAGRYGRPTLALVAGHYPHGPGQVALTSQTAALYNAHAGGIWRQGGRARRVVGIVENPGNLLDEFALVSPGQVGAPTEVTVLFDATRASAAAFRFPPGAIVQTPPQQSGGIGPAFIVLAAAMLGLIFVGLVAVASFTVLARRRLRALGMLGSLGAAESNIALVMTANGAIAGTAGAVAGALAGFAAWLGYRRTWRPAPGTGSACCTCPGGDRDRDGPRRRYLGAGVLAASPRCGQDVRARSPGRAAGTAEGGAPLCPARRHPAARRPGPAGTVRRVGA